MTGDDFPVPPTILWKGGTEGVVDIIDQTLLPGREERRDIATLDDLIEAIRSLRVRGAPAIGIAAAYGMVLGCRTGPLQDPAAFRARMEEVARRIKAARPTAVNPMWAVDRLLAAVAASGSADPRAILERLLAEAHAILEEDLRTCRRLGELAADLIADGDVVLTHCNAGSLATSRRGTALAGLYEARARGRRIRVFAGETRPLLQGARLTTWELMKAGIDVTLITDSTAAHVMRTQGVRRIFVGADRIAANGDTANKIGTAGLAFLARAHGIPFHVVAPRSTFDLSVPDGSRIPIEERPAAEITEAFGLRVAPPGARVYAPAFDVTPAMLITSLITEAGIIEPADSATIRKVLGPGG